MGFEPGADNSNSWTNDKEKTANVINSILHNSKKRISIVDSKNLSAWTANG